MAPRPELPASLKAEVDRILAESAKAFQGGNLDLALSLALQAWDVIPEPKASWNYYPQSLAAGFVEDYTDLGDLDAVKRWTGVVYEVYDDPNRENHYTLMIEGRALHRLGQTDAAAAIFGRVLSLYGPEGFKGADRIYLDLAEQQN